MPFSVLAAFTAALASRRFFRSPVRMRILNRTPGTRLIGSGVTVAAG